MNEAPKLENIWEGEVLHKICEDASEVDGVHVLAKVRGPAFFPDTTSGNRTFYPLEAWEKALSEPRVQKRLRDRLMYGTIGHNQVLDDDAIKDGKFSHLITDIFINEEGVGEAEYLVLNTPTGRILNTILRVGSKIRVSTKAKGLFLNGSSGNQRTVNPDMFFFERIDFVLEPGYDEALPDLIESLDDETTDPVNEDIPVDKTQDDAVALLKIVESAVEELKAGDAVTAESIQELTAKVGEVAATVVTLAQENTEIAAELAKAQETIKEYEELGTPEEVSEALDKCTETVTALQNRLNTALHSVSESLILDEVQEELNAYKAFGSIKDLEELVEHSEALADRFIQEQLKSLASKFDVQESAVKQLFSKGLELKDIEESLTLIAKPKAKPAKPARSKRPHEMSTKDFSGATQINESVTIGTRASSLSLKLMTLNSRGNRG